MACQSYDANYKALIILQKTSLVLLNSAIHLLNGQINTGMRPKQHSYRHLPAAQPRALGSLPAWPYNRRTLFVELVMPNLHLADLTAEIEANVRRALAEDIGSGDITARLIPAERLAKATIITRDNAVISGTTWVDAVFRQLDPRVAVHWQVADGERVSPNQALFHLEGPARSLLSGERSALNFLQMLSGVATHARQLADQVAQTQVKLLDTRKTLPGLRLAQKYAVTCGGCHNHRIGLYDAFLIKENHIAACGGIAQAISAAHKIAPGKPVEIEVESLAELKEALAAGADIIMLDELSMDDMREAVRLNAGKAKLEASGGINESTLLPIAQTGVDYISIGAMTKDVKAVDLSMRLSL
ncbi:Nicotinate-nucleotide pyrophosphorylase [carboxylating] [Pseudomonas sp. TAD18]|nr:Nicotinate-nucleotide pyrophosphorylase [carboxylating] [Pseudomonas sp. TAD18]KVV11538.1 Nicotinate-nucleotide pyrophosphorylase [carboxylating] [Pseudomonas sp. TAA207]